MNASSSCSQAHREQKGESGARCSGLDESGFSHGGLRGLVRGPDSFLWLLATCSGFTQPQQDYSPSSHPFNVSCQHCTWAHPSPHRWLAGSAALGVLWGFIYLFPIYHFISLLVPTYFFLFTPHMPGILE